MSERIETLEEQFGDLHNQLVKELTDRRISVDNLLQALTLLPFAFRKQYESAIQSMLPELENRDDISNLFHRLNPLFTFIDYKLLQYLVSKFGSAELKKKMTLYVEKVHLFKKGTTVSELIDYWPSLDLPHLNYCQLRAKFDGDPRTYTLEKLDYFRGRFYNHVKLSDFVSVSILMLVEPTNSFVAVWYVPSAIVHELMEAVRQSNRRFFQAEHVLELTLDERILYHPRYSLSESMINESALLTSTHVSYLVHTVVMHTKCKSQYRRRRTTHVIAIPFNSDVRYCMLPEYILLHSMPWLCTWATFQLFQCFNAQPLLLSK